MIGLAPSMNNIVYQMYAQKLIPLPTAHIFIRNDYFDGLLAFGVDSQEIVELNSNHWIVELENFQLNGLRYGKKTKPFSVI
ncbi:hypothetical protein M3Y98_00095000 [Aphelenchoides besseyi]|nr:hypothetical protein M3Y98_00095000 [Aphelenchoides besseyi]KAI6198552.1 hypothetical protein M3Y96_00531400 [Aphelenchoides besseyi]